MQFTTLIAAVFAVAGFASAYGNDHLYVRELAHLEARDAAAEAYEEAFEEALYRRGGAISKVTANCKKNSDCNYPKENCVYDQYGKGHCKKA